MDIKEIINKNKEELIGNLSKLVSYKSVYNKDENSTPFGAENAACLKKALELAHEYGFETKNLDDYCGYAEIGSGDKIIGIAVHLDVVPAGDGWKTEPFCATIKDGKIYGRGTSDDKGAVVACLLALKIVNNLNISINKRVRLILGCNEENGSKCMKYYVEKEGDIDIGFTPDGEFPGVIGEKGQIKVIFESKETSIIDIRGGIVDNAVCSSCSIIVKKDSYDKDKLKKYFDNNDIEYSIIQNKEEETINVSGIAAHAAKPKLGKNAISYALVGLRDAGYKDIFVDFYCDTIGLETDGNGLGIKCSDEYGELTCVNGMVWMENDKISGTLDIRTPVTKDILSIIERLNTKDYIGGYIKINRYSNCVYKPINSPLVKKLLNAYQEVTNDFQSKPVVRGGGTYAKSLNNCIAFGCKFKETNNRIHNSDEFVGIDELLLQVEIYVKAILNLLED